MADVVVVGAGIVASVAYHAAGAGAGVTLLDKSLPASGVTRDSFAWIGGPGGGDVPDGSTPLRRTVLQDYRRLEAQLPGVQVRWSGSLSWTGSGPREHLDLGPDEQLVDRVQAARLEPNLRVPPARALHKTSDGAVDPVAVTEVLIRGARDHGAEVVLGVAAAGLRVRNGQVVGVETSTGFLPAGTVVLTAGADAPVLCYPLGFDLPVAPSPVLLLRFAAPPELVRTLVASPEIDVRQATDDQLLVAADYTGQANHDDLVRTGQETLRCATVDDLLPRVDLPDVFLEVAQWTGFLTAFTHISEGPARADTSASASAPSWSPKRATSGWNPWSSPGPRQRRPGRCVLGAQSIEGGGGRQGRRRGSVGRPRHAPWGSSTTGMPASPRERFRAHAVPLSHLRRGMPEGMA